MWGAVSSCHRGHRTIREGLTKERAMMVLRPAAMIEA